ncbi:MAG: T9SS type A sorting domain-containing protein [Bacteroidota bacterium]
MIDIGMKYYGLLFALIIGTLASAFSQDALWLDQVGPSSYDAAGAIATDASGFVYTAGKIGTASGSSGTYTFGGNSYPGYGNNDLFIAKMDSNGVYQWVIIMPDAGNTRPGLAVDQIGNVYLASYVFSNPTTLGTFSILPANGQFYLAKINTAGVAQWVEQYSSSGFDGFGSLATDFGGNLLITGVYGNYVGNFDGLNLPNFPGSLSSNIFTAKMDSNGNTLWASSLVSQQGGNAGYTSSACITSDSVGNVYIGGGFGQDLKVNNVGAVIMSNTSTDSSDAFIVKYDALGNYIWDIEGNGPGHVFINDVAVGNGSVFATGMMSDDATFGSISLTAQGFANVVLMQADGSGTVTYALREGTMGWNLGRSVEVNQKGNLIVGGAYSGNSVFSGTTLPGAISDDKAFIANYSSGLSLNWIADYGAGTGWANLLDMAIAGMGRIYANGYFSGAIAFGSQNASATTNWDAFTFCVADSLCPILPPPPPPLPADSVWPGDTDYDGIANNFDLLPIGLAYGYVEFERPNASLNWVGQAAPDWNDTLPSGVNYKHIDTNGDSLITNADTMGIFLNYGLTHNKTDGGNKVGPPIFLTFADDTLQAGDTTEVIINLGTDSISVDSMYGLAFSVLYDSSLIDAFNISASYDNSWLGTDDVDMLSMERNFPNDQQIDFALTRIDQATMSGSGEIGKIVVIMVDDLTAKMPITEVLTMSVVNVYAHNARAEEIDLSPQSSSVVLTQEDVSTSLNPALLSALRVYPNPADQNLRIELDGVQGESLSLYNLAGQTILQQTGTFTNETLSTDRLPQGLYVLQIQTADGIISKRIMIQH